MLTKNLNRMFAKLGMSTGGSSGVVMKSEIVEAFAGMLLEISRDIDAINKRISEHEIQASII